MAGCVRAVMPRLQVGYGTLHCSASLSYCPVLFLFVLWVGKCGGVCGEEEGGVRYEWRVCVTVL